MQENKFIGEWILQAEKSKYDVGNAPLNATYTFRAIEDDKLKVTIDWKNFDESEQSVSYVILMDVCMNMTEGKLQTWLRQNLGVKTFWKHLYLRMAG